MKIYSFEKKSDTVTEEKIKETVNIFLSEKNAEFTGKVSVFRDDYGKPKLAGIENLYVSVTHAENLLLVAVSDREIGIDAEQVNRKVRNFHSLANRYFTKEELDFLGDNYTIDDFLRMWVKKEALSKLTGRGIPDFKEYSIFSEKFKISENTDYTNFIIYIAEYKEN